MATAGFLPGPDTVAPADSVGLAREILGWITTDEVIQITPELTNETMIRTINPTSDSFNLVRQQTVSTEQLMTVRTLVMVMAALGQLRSTNNWHRIAREWQFGDPAVIELGREEADSGWTAMSGPVRVAVR